MKRIFFSKKIHVILATLIACFSIGAWGNAMVLNGQSLDSIQAQLDQINGQISNYQSDISSEQSQVTTLLSQKDSLQQNVYSVQTLLSQANGKETAIQKLINSLQSLQAAAQTKLNQEVALRDQSMLNLYETTNENPFFLFMSSSNASTFLYKLALNETEVDGQKQELLSLNGQITSLQNSLTSENKEKATQLAQVAKIKSQEQAEQAALAAVQNSYASANNKISSDQGHISSLQAQYGQLSAQENAILEAKTNSQFSYTSSIPQNCQSSATPKGNLPTGAGGSFAIAVNGNVIKTNQNAVVDIVPNGVNDDNTVNGNGHTGCFAGVVEFRGDTNANFINQTSMENYVQGIGEMPGDWQTQALDAQAIAARTYAEHVKSDGAAASNESSNHYDLDNTTAYQSYVGVQGGTKAQSGLDTIAQVVDYKGSAIDAEYSANNGGYEKSNQDVWGSSPDPYLPSQSDSFGSVQYDDFADPDGMCAAYVKSVSGGEFYRSANPATWVSNNGAGTNGVVSFTGGAGTFAEIMGIAMQMQQQGGVSNINLSNPSQYINQFNSAVGSYTSTAFTFSNGRSSSSSSDSYNTLISPNGNTERTVSLTLHGSAGSVAIREDWVRWAYNVASPGGDYLDSPDGTSASLWYFVDGGGNETFYTFGYGHGVGMSQCGAEGRAAAGQNASQILGFYYPGTSITQDGQITGTNPQSCGSVSGYTNNDACIRVGVDNYSSHDNIITEHDAYSIYINGSVVFSGNSGDTIEIQQS
jgi:SpoIID/LytB domain protein